MGNAHATVVNKTPKKVCVLTFDQADLIYNKYNKMYIIDPGCTMLVEALSDPWGLKIAIVYDASPDGNILMYQRWGCKNESTLTITQFVGADISTFGDETKSQGKGELTEKNEEAFAKAVEALTYVSPVSRANLRK